MPRLLPVHAGWIGAQRPDAPGVDLPAAPSPGALGNLEQEMYQLELSAALSLGFPVATVSTGLSHAVLLLGTTRYTDVVGAGQHVFRFGVALRALIVVSSAKIDFALTLPVVAAKVQLSAAEASAQLLVQGYKGALGPALPAWQDFDVDSYASYMRHVSALQAKIMDDTANIVPELLGTSAASSGAEATFPTPSTAVGVLYALQAIAHGASLSHALDQFSDEDQQARAAVRVVYTERVGADDGARPDDATQQGARTALLGYHLGKGIFTWS